MRVLLPKPKYSKGLEKLFVLLFCWLHLNEPDKKVELYFECFPATVLPVHNQSKLPSQLAPMAFNESKNLSPQSSPTNSLNFSENLNEQGNTATIVICTITKI